FADVCLAQNSQTLSVSRHDAVLDSVVHHLDEVACAAWPAVQISLFSRTDDLLAPRSARYIADARRNRFENRIEVLHSRGGAADHHAVAALQTPHSAAFSDIHVLKTFRSKFRCAADVVDVIGITAVDQDVSTI